MLFQRLPFDRSALPLNAFLNISPALPVVIVPDVHQDLAFLEYAAAFAQREGAALCFLGDTVDAINPRWRESAALQSVAKALPELAESHPHGCTFLAGNHDVEALRLGRLRARHLLEDDSAAVATLDAAYPAAPAYTQLLGAWTTSFLRTWSIAAVAHGFLLSHAGVARRYWPWAASAHPADQAATFLDETHQAWLRWLQTGEENALFAVGPARGGKNAPVGGPLWLDWDYEFVDDLPLPQIVGHTRNREPRRKDRSWCLDAAQSALGLLHPDLGLRVIRL